MPRDRRPGPNRPASTPREARRRQNDRYLNTGRQSHAASPPVRPRATERRPAARAGFTLTELLVVISIIAVLASLGTYGAMRALDTAKQARIKAEVDQIDMALKAYREKYGSYPPCDLRSSNRDCPWPAVRSHVARVFPRYYDLYAM